MYEPGGDVSQRSERPPHPTLLDGLDADASVVLFLRHAERPALAPDPSSHAVRLTIAGRESAAALGRSLSTRLGAVRTSPIVRCVETAEALLRGAGRDEAPVPDPALGNPGPFVADLALAWAEWQRLGHEGVMTRLVSGVDDIPGLHPIRQTAWALLEHALAAVEGQPGVHAFISHDVVLAPLLVGLLDRPLTRDEWPRFLEPIAVRRDAISAVLRYRTMELRIDRGARPAR